MIRIFKEFIKENPEIWTPKLKKNFMKLVERLLSMKTLLLDLAFEMGPMKGLTAQEVKDYIRFIGNRRLVQLGLEPIYDVKNPYWLDTMLNAVEHMNFLKVELRNILKLQLRERGLRRSPKIDWILNSKNIGAKQD